MPEPKYKWDSAQEWLQQYLAGLGPVELLQEARNLASKMDGDEIQDIYQSDMGAQGYFLPLTRSYKCPECAFEFEEEIDPGDDPETECKNPACDALVEPLPV